MADGDPWSFLDAVFVITLDTATTRHVQVQDELTRVGLWPKTTVLMNARDPLGGVRGCHESHRLAWERAKQLGFENVLIVEDDVFFADDWRKHVHVVRDFVNNEQEEPWDCLFLGWTPRRSFKTRNKHVDRIVCGSATHAYIANARAFAKGLPVHEDAGGMPLDIFMMCPQCPRAKQRHSAWGACLTSENEFTHRYDMYAFRPMIAFQRFDGTSATRASVNKKMMERKQNVRMLRWYGSLCRYGNTNAIDAWTVALIVLIVFIVLCITIPLCVLKYKRN